MIIENDILRNTVGITIFYIQHIIKFKFILYHVHFIEYLNLNM